LCCAFFSTVVVNYADYVTMLLPDLVRRLSVVVLVCALILIVILVFLCSRPFLDRKESGDSGSEQEKKAEAATTEI
jgi:hypothetical protein